MERAAALLPLCSEETVHVPLECLTQFSKLDEEACAQVCPQVMPAIVELYARYYSDGLIGSDIVDLLKLWARVPNNQAFTQGFLKTHVLGVLRQYYHSVMRGSAGEAQKLIDSSVLKVRRINVSKACTEHAERALFVFTFWTADRS